MFLFIRDVTLRLVLTVEELILYIYLYRFNDLI